MENKEREQEAKLINEKKKEDQIEEHRTKKTKARQQASQGIFRFCRENFTVIDSIQLRPEAQQTTFASSNIARRLTTPQIFDLHFPQVIWEHLAEKTMQRMKEKMTSGEVTGGYAVLMFILVVDAR